MALDDVIEWFKTKIKYSEEDPDHRVLECSLIRCMSDYRKIEISELHISSDFQAQFLRALDQVELIQEIGSEDHRKGEFFRSRGFRYSMAFASFAVVLGFFYMNLKDPDMKGVGTAGALTLDPVLLQELNEEFQLINDIRNSDDIRSLKRLEEYYISHGITDRATRIHYSLETISSK